MSNPRPEGTRVKTATPHVPPKPPNQGRFVVEGRTMDYFGYWIQVSDNMKVLTINGKPAVHIGNNTYVPKED